MGSRYKLALAGLVLAGALAHGIGNWDAMAYAFGVTTQRAPEPGSDDVSSEEVVGPRADPTDDALTSSSTVMTRDEVAPSVPEPARQEPVRRTEPPLSDVADRFLSDPMVVAAQPTRSPFHLPIEAVQGVLLDELLQRLVRESDRPSTSMPADASAPSVTPAVVLTTTPGLESLAEATVSGIMLSARASVCVVNGNWLTVGDTYPRTKITVAEIKAREVVFTDGERTLAVRLDTVGTRSEASRSEPRAATEL